MRGKTAEGSLRGPVRSQEVNAKKKPTRSARNDGFAWWWRFESRCAVVAGK